jgi:hypothetical protein
VKQDIRALSFHGGSSVAQRFLHEIKMHLIARHDKRQTNYFHRSPRDDAYESRRSISVRANENIFDASRRIPFVFMRA